MKVPPLLPRFVPLDDGQRFVPLEQVIAANLRPASSPTWRSGATTPSGSPATPISTSRRSEADDLLAAVEIELRRRRFGRAVRLEVDPEMPAGGPRAAARASSSSTPDDVYESAAPLDLGPALGDPRARPARAARAARGRRSSRRRLADGRRRAGRPLRGAPRARRARPPPLRLLRHLGRGVHRPGGRRPRRARHQADPLPHLGRHAVRGGARPGGRGGQAGGGARRAEGPLRRAARTSPGRGSSSRPACTSSTASSA